MALPNNKKPRGLGDIRKDLQTGNILPRMTTAERDALAAGDKFKGLVIYNTTTNKINQYTGAAWEAVTSA